MIARRRHTVACWVSLVAQVISLAGWLFLLWFDEVIRAWFGWEAQEITAKSCASVTLVGVSSLHIALLGLLRIRGALGRATRVCAGIFIAGALLIVTELIWDEELRFTLDALNPKPITLPRVMLLCVHLGLVSVLVARRKQRRIGRFELIPFLIWTLLFALIIVRRLGLDEEVQWRAFGGLLILGAFCTLACPLIAYLENLASKGGEDASFGRTVQVAMSCPRCAAEFAIRANRSEQCRSCGLRVTVNLEEPRCTCGYLLYGLTSDVCPECGKPIPDDLRWRGPADGSETSEPEHDDRSDGALPGDALDPPG
jgi:hypothetical protein